MLSELALLRLRFRVEVSAPVSLPPYKGDMLRRALLWYLGTIWCRQPERCRTGCQQPHECLFGRLLEPPVNLAWSEPIRRLMGSTPPPLYVLWDEQDRRRHLETGDLFHFELTLVGQAAIQQVPAFIAAMMAAAERGIGEERLRGRLRQVDALAGVRGQPCTLFENGTWQGHPLEDLAVHWEDGREWAQEAASASNGSRTRLRVHFLSPLKVEMRGEVAREPQFAPLARGVVRRLRILSEVHGAGEWPREEYGPLLDLADEVQLEHHETAWVSADRYSQRGGRMPLEGFVGQAWYAADVDLGPLLPALWLGQWLHVGKGAVWGWGRYEVGVKER